MGCLLAWGQRVSGQGLSGRQLQTVNRVVLPDTAGVIHLNAAAGTGLAWISGAAFGEGVIEVDVRGRDLFQQSFVGIAYHGVNDSTYEAVYFRPFNFRSADPARRLHAVEYIALPKYDWPVLRAQFPNHYEQPVTPAPDPNAWFHVRIEVKKEKLRVFVNGEARPCLEIEPLVPLAKGKIGYWVGNGSEGEWRGMKVGM